MSNLPAFEKETLLPEVSSNENELAVQHQSHLPDINYDQPEESKSFRMSSICRLLPQHLVLSMEKGKEAKVCWCQFSCSYDDYSV